MTESHELTQQTSSYPFEPYTTGTAFLSGSFGNGHAIEYSGARLHFQVGGRLTFMIPGTMTQSEARETFFRLTESLDARLQCHLIIQSAPAEVVPAILPQIKDMVEYEVQMAQVRHEIEGPDIRERWVYLPVSS